jgi:very-short-patch-repair endonuclease
LPSADARIAALAAEDWGVLSIEELRMCGLSRLAVARRERRGVLHRMHQGVYAVGHRAVALEGIWLAAVKACGEEAVLSHYSAAAHWGFVPWDDRLPEVTVPGSGTRRHQAVRVHRSALLDRKDAMVRDGIPVTAPARTLLDLAAILPYRPLRRAIREAMALRRVAIRQLVDALARRGPSRGSRNFARIIADGYTPSESMLSDIVLDLILAGGFERPDVSKPMVLDGRRVVPDFRWPKQRIVVEADGGQWHDHPLARQDDAERDALLEAHGHHVVHVTWNQAVAKQRQTLARFEAAGAPKHRAST